MQIRLAVLVALGWAALAGSPLHAAVKAGGTGLAINNSGRIDLVTSTPVAYTNRSVANGRRIINLRVGQPVLCADFAATPGGAVNPVGLQIIDPNGDSSGLMFGGVSSYDYFTNGGAPSLFKVTSDTQLACCTMLPAANASCTQGPNGGSLVDTFFANGYESPISGVAGKAVNTAADLLVSMSGPTTVPQNANFNYTINVSNTGTTASSAVRVRDWFPKAAGGFPAPLATGSWNCTATGGASCGSASGAGNVNLDAVSLPGGTSISIAVSRTMAAGAVNGTQFSVSAAAFSPPTALETNLTNNQAALSASVQNSASPTIGAIGSQSSLEDVATGAIAVTANDSDTVLTPASLSCSSNNSALVDASRCQFTGTEPNFSLVITPKPNANGNATVTVTVNDGSTQASTGFSYSVTTVNDAPDFTLAANRTYPSGSTGIKVVSDFATALVPGGGPDEAGQSVTVVSTTVQPGAGSIFASGGAPTYDSGKNILSFQLNGLSGVAIVRVRVQDSGANGGANGDVNFRERDFTITVQASD